MPLRRISNGSRIIDSFNTDVSTPNDTGANWQLPRFGVFGPVYIDFKTLKRTPKLSTDWFHEAAKHNAVV